MAFNPREQDVELEKIKTLKYILDGAKKYGLVPTSTTGGRHNTGSYHYKGQAVDTDPNKGDTEGFKRYIQAAGGVYRDERTRPKGQAVWGGPHNHWEIPMPIVDTDRLGTYTAASSQPVAAPIVVPKPPPQKGSPLDIMAAYNPQQSAFRVPDPEQPFPTMLPVQPQQYQMPTQNLSQAYPQQQTPDPLAFIQRQTEEYNRQVDEAYSGANRSVGGNALLGLLLGGPLGAYVVGRKAALSNRSDRQNAAEAKGKFATDLMARLGDVQSVYKPYQDAQYSNQVYGTPNLPASTELLKQGNADVGAGSTMETYAGYLDKLNAYNQTKTLLISQRDYEGVKALGAPPQAPSMAQGRAGNATLLQELVNQRMNPSNTTNDINLAKAPSDIYNTTASGTLANTNAQLAPRETAAKETSANASMTNANANMMDAGKPDKPSQIEFAYSQWKSENPQGTFDQFMNVYKPPSAMDLLFGTAAAEGDLGGAPTPKPEKPKLKNKGKAEKGSDGRTYYIDPGSF